MTKLLIFDTTLRDGEQSPGATMTMPEKIRMARQLERLGVDVLEAGFPVSSPDDFRAVAAIAKAVRSPIIAALARAKAADIERAAASLNDADRPRIHVFLATSQLHLERKLEISTAQCLDAVAESVARARSLVDDVEFSPEDATRTDPGFLCRVVEAAIQAGATTVNIPDTVGCTYPTEYATLLRGLLASVQGIEDVVLSAHCHDDLGLAVANSLAAAEVGARQIECTINGIGERAGNAALEEVVMAMRVRKDLLPFETNIKTEELYPTSRLLTSLTGIQPQPNKAIIGKNAFAHEAGIHQAGVLKESLTYEIMKPAEVGITKSTLVLGKHSGRRAVEQRCRDLGYDLTSDALDRLYQRIVQIAEQKHDVLDEDILAVLQASDVVGTESRFELVGIEVTCGGPVSRALVRVTDGVYPTQEGEAEGDGPLAAAFSALDELLGAGIHLDDMHITPATPGSDAVGKVTLHASVEGRTFIGRGASTDIVLAAAEAYLHIVNKAVRLGVFSPKSFEFEHNFWAV